MNREDNMSRKAQSTFGYVFVMVIVAIALIAMRAYIKRSAQGKIREIADNVSGGMMYSPGNTNSNYALTRDINETSSSHVEETSDGEKNISEGEFEMNQQVDRTEQGNAFLNEPWR